MPGHHLAAYQTFRHQFHRSLLASSGKLLVFHEIPSFREHDGHALEASGTGRHLLFHRGPSVDTQANGITIGKHRHVFRRKGSAFIGDVHHRAGTQPVARLLGTLGHKCVIGGFGLPESIQNTAVEGIRMVTALMVERMPQAAAEMIGRSGVQRIVRRIWERGLEVVKGLHHHGSFTPVTGYTGGGVVGGPGIHVITEFTGEIRFAVLPFLDGPVFVPRNRVGIQNFIMLAALSHRVASGVASLVRIFLMHQVAGLFGEIRRVMSFIQNRFPHHHGGMVPIPAHHLADIVIHPVSKRAAAPELPARRGDDDEKAQTVAGVHESRILRIMGAPDHAHACLPQFHGILPLQVVGHCIPKPGKILVPVAANQLFRKQGSIEHQPLFRNFHRPDTHPYGTVVQQMGRIFGMVPSNSVPYFHAQRVQIGIVRRPRFHVGKHKRNIHFTRGMGRNSQRNRLPGRIHPLGVRHHRLHAHLPFLVCLVGHLNLHPHLALAGTGIKKFRPEKNSPSGHSSGLVRVRDIHGSGGNEVHIPVNTAKIGKIQAFLGFAGGIGSVVGIVRLHGDDILLSRFQPLVQIDNHGKISAEMLRGLLPIHPDLALSHDALKIQGVSPPLQPGGRNKCFPVPYRPLVVGTAAGLFRKKLNAVGEVDGLPGGIVNIRAGRFLRCLLSLEQFPAHIHAVNVPFRYVFRQAKSPCHGIGSRR